MNMFNRRQFIGRSVAATVGVGWVDDLMARPYDTGTRLLKIDNIIRAPDDPKAWPAWRRQLKQWRAEARAKLRYDDSYYRQEAFAWTASDFACCFLMMCDLMFYDPEAGTYQVDSLLEYGRKEFGGFDSVVLWHAYPRIGFDQRNQFDFYRDMPGGLAALQSLTRTLHNHGVKVFIDYNPWDRGTRREENTDFDVLAELVQAMEADGIFLDTMQQAEALRDTLDASRSGAVLESELALPLSEVATHHMSWAQRFQDSHAPGVLRNKWFERRHMQHQIRRWDEDHTAELHTAWMNGSGMLVWENVFGSLKLWSPRDRSILRAMLPIQRRYRRLLSGEDWTPLVRTTPASIVARPAASKKYAVFQNEAGVVRLKSGYTRDGRHVVGVFGQIRNGRGDTLLLDILPCGHYPPDYHYKPVERITLRRVTEAGEKRTPRTEKNNKHGHPTSGALESEREYSEGDLRPNEGRSPRR